MRDGYFLGEIDTTLSLAPGEELSLRIRRTQREKLVRTHVDQREQILNFENTIQDKDVVAATRSSARQYNWNIDCRSQVSLGLTNPISLSTGVSGGFNLGTEISQTNEPRRSACMKRRANQAAN